MPELINLIVIKLLTSGLLEIFGSWSQFLKRGENDCFDPLADAHALSIVIKSCVFYERPISTLCCIQLSVTWQC